MTRYIVRRLLQAVPLILLISVLTFTLYRLAPNSPFRAELAGNPEATEEDILALESKYGLDRPIPVQYLEWMSGVVRGDFGKSYFTKRPVMEMIAERLPNTLVLTGSGFLLSLVIGVTLGLIAALNHNSALDATIRVTTSLVSALPAWAIGLLCVVYLGGQLRLFPQGGMFSVGQADNFGDRLWHLALPALVAGIDGSIGYLRIIRSQTLEVMRSDYIRTARAKGLTASMVTTRHVLRNVILPVWTGFGGLLAGLISGAAIFERVFSWPGMGQLVLEAAFKRDFPVILASSMIGAVLLLVGYIIVDIGYAWLDPRVRL